MPFPSPLTAHLADLERRDVAALTPVPRPNVRGSEHWSWWDLVDRELIRQAHEFRAQHDVAVVADRLHSLKASGAGPWLIERNRELLAALRGDPRPYLAMHWSAMTGCANTKGFLHTWAEAHAEMTGVDWRAAA